MVNAWTWGLLAGTVAAAVFAKLDLAPSDDDNRRVLAVLAYLNT